MTPLFVVVIFQIIRHLDDVPASQVGHGEQLASTNAPGHWIEGACETPTVSAILRPLHDPT